MVKRTYLSDNPAGSSKKLRAAMLSVCPVAPPLAYTCMVVA